MVTVTVTVAVALAATQRQRQRRNTGILRCAQDDDFQKWSSGNGGSGISGVGGGNGNCNCRGNCSGGGNGNCDWNRSVGVAMVSSSLMDGVGWEDADDDDWAFDAGD
jgi:hypothetical protein